MNTRRLEGPSRPPHTMHCSHALALSLSCSQGALSAALPPEVLAEMWATVCSEAMIQFVAGEARYYKAYSVVMKTLVLSWYVYSVCSDSYIN